MKQELSDVFHHFKNLKGFSEMGDCSSVEDMAVNTDSESRMIWNKLFVHSESYHVIAVDFEIVT